jgi:hypothetical protein
MIHELERESQERFQNAYEALRLPDPDGYTGTVEREYQKELARNLQKEGSKAANASTDQRIAGKLKVAGYSLGEIQKVIEQYSPMAVKPSQDQSQAYAKTVIQRAYFPGGTDLAKQSGERRLDRLAMETKVGSHSEVRRTDIQPQFKWIHLDEFQVILELCGRMIQLPKDIVIGNNHSPVSIFLVSQAIYQDDNAPLQASDADALQHYLVNQALAENIDIIVE